MRRRGAVSCSWARGRLEMFPGADLGSGAHARLRSHLIECRSCRAALGPVLAAQRALRGAVPPDALPTSAPRCPAVDRSFFAAMHRAILTRVRGLPPPVRRRWRSGLAAAAMLFGLGLAITAHRPPPAASLLARPPIRTAPSPGDGPGATPLIVSVSHSPAWQGLLGRRRALRCLKLGIDRRPAGSRAAASDSVRRRR